MSELNCKNCGNSVKTGDANCPHCGIPLPPDFGKHPQRKFKLFVIAIIIFCIIMIIWLPPNWSRFMGN